MEQVEVEILVQVITGTAHGTLNPGAILRTDAAFAKHLVDDCRAAKYRTAKPAPKVSIDPLLPAAPKASKKKEKAAAAGGSTLPQAGEQEAPPADAPPVADVCTSMPVGDAGDPPG